MFTCQECDKDFRPTHRPCKARPALQRYCSKTCADRSNVLSETKTCAFCKADFVVSGNRARRKVTCSDDCQQALRVLSTFGPNAPRVVKRRRVLAEASAEERREREVAEALAAIARERESREAYAAELRAKIEAKRIEWDAATVERAETAEKKVRKRREKKGNFMRKLTDDQVRDIRRLAAEGMGHVQIVRDLELPVTSGPIRDIVEGRTYANVT